MASPSNGEPSDVWTADLRFRADELLDEYRASLHDSLDGLTEEEARLRLVPSKTTLLGLVARHLRRGCLVRPGDQRPLVRRHRHPRCPRPIVALTKHDTIASVQAAHRRRCDLSRRTIAALGLAAVVDGRGPRPVAWALQLQVLRELAQHAGHADILREQILARRGD